MDNNAVSDLMSAALAAFIMFFLFSLLTPENQDQDKVTVIGKIEKSGSASDSPFFQKLQIDLEACKKPLLIARTDHFQSVYLKKHCSDFCSDLACDITISDNDKTVEVNIRDNDVNEYQLKFSEAKTVVHRRTDIPYYGGSKASAFDGENFFIFEKLSFYLSGENNVDFKFFIDEDHPVKVEQCGVNKNHIYVDRDVNININIVHFPSYSSISPIKASNSLLDQPDQDNININLRQSLIPRKEMTLLQNGDTEAFEMERNFSFHLKINNGEFSYE